MLRILKITKLPVGLQPLNALRAYSTSYTEIPDKNEYIPGVQGYAPGFGPPPRKPLTERKLRKKNAHLKKKMSFVSPKAEVPQEAAEMTTETKKEVVPETLAESISIIKQNIDVAGMTYKNKVHLIRHQYTLEMQQLKKKQAEKAEQEAAKAKEIQLLEEREKEARAKALHASRINDHLSSLNLPLPDSKLDENETSHKKLSPFVDPGMKASRIAVKAMNHSEVVKARKAEVKESLLRLFYEASDYVTPENIDAKLDQFIGQGTSAGKGFVSSKSLSFTARSTEHPVDTTRDSKLFDILQGTISGKPGVEKIEQNRSSGLLAKDLASVMKGDS